MTGYVCYPSSRADQRRKGALAATTIFKKHVSRIKVREHPLVHSIKLFFVLLLSSVGEGGKCQYRAPLVNRFGYTLVSSYGEKFKAESMKNAARVCPLPAW